ncbi:Protein of unknown function [Maledivibacter halophilus]|uniref:DUF3307 domain-containing protein n=2 Tax=Maledivibacter halophilus TaxID=36842 RepID=A0A1T5IPK5_9FIRM|nr:Protein of unknown function [Maledivibacter halophilus]
MYSNLIISLLILSHIVGDFYLQNNKIAKGKIHSDNILLKHSIHHFLTSLLLTISFFSIKLTIILFGFAFSHYLVDKHKIRLSKKYNKYSLILFFTDQFLHILIIFAAYPLYHFLDLNTLYINLSNMIINIYPILKVINNNIWTQLILSISFFLFIINGGTIITKLTLLELSSQYTSEAKNNEAVETHDISNTTNPSIHEIAATLDESNSKSGGEIIGILERILIFTFILINNYVAITFVITAKSIARFDKITKDKSFSDKFLIGTLTSTSIAIFCGFLYKVLFLK